MNMKMPAMSFEFGPAKNVAFSPYGLAITDGNKWITYDANNAQTIDVTGFTFDIGNMIYKMPVAIKDVKIGDLIAHQDKAVFVTEVNDTKLTVVDILASEEKTVIPVSNMFGFNFVTKVVSLMNLNIGSPNPDQPFGNLMPLMMFSAVFGDNKNGDTFGEMDIDRKSVV